MTENFRILNLAIELSGVILSTLALLQIYFGAKLDQRTERYFIPFYGGLILLLVSNMAGLLMRGLPGAEYRTALYISNYLEFLLPAVLAFLITNYLLSIVDSEYRLKKLRLLSYGLLLLHVVILTSSQFTGLLYRIDSKNFYQRQAWYPLAYLATAGIILMNFCLLLLHQDKLTSWERSAFWLYLLLPSVGMAVQIFQYGFNATLLSIIVGAFAMYVFIVHDQTERYYRQRAENALQRASIQVLQMRPHYICNTMLSIYHLCQQDPQKAQQLTLDFTNYLRSNFTAIAKEGTIPFMDELEHTRAYLAVEQVRFQGKLFVKWDTPFLMFQLPPLTLQPIVENAVKHGVIPDLPPLYLSILTRETKTGVRITVEDNGPGYTPADDDLPHIALANIRERLEIMCHGTLEVMPRPSGGTSVTIWLPWKNET